VIADRLESLARRFIEGRERARLSRQFGRTLPADLPLEFLRIASVLKAYELNIGRLIDVGAHKGGFAQAVAAAWTLEELLCIEPNEQMLGRLCSVLPPVAKIIPAALCEEEGQTTYYLHPNSAMNSIRPVDTPKFNESFGTFHTADQITSRTVRTRTLDSLLYDLRDQTSRNILLKIDTQGAEMAVLRTGTKILKLSSACIVEYMFWSGYQKSYDLNDLLGLMGKQGFVCEAVLEPHFRGGRAAYTDVLFLPSKILSQ
jgi:FkbM family methyltransferase